MKKILLSYLTVFALVFTSFAQVTITTTFNYQNLLPSGNCFLYIPPGPNAPTSIQGYDHYAVVGGPYNTGSELQLLGDLHLNGMAFGIYYPFNPLYKYTIVVTSKGSSSGGSQVSVTASTCRSAIPSTCNSGFANIIRSCENKYNFYWHSNTDLTYSDHTVISDYTPTTSNVNYLLIGAFPINYINGATNGPVVSIKSITIHETRPTCNLPAPTGLTTSADLSTLQWNAVAGAASYKVQISTTRAGVTTTQTLNSTTNSLTYCPQSGDLISFTVAPVCPNQIVGGVSGAYNYTFSSITASPTNLTATISPQGSYYGYYINFTPVPGFTEYTMQWFDLTTNSYIYSNGYINYTGTNSVFIYQFPGGHTFQYRVAVYTTCGNTPFSSWSSPMLPPGPSCATGPTSSSLAQARGCGSSGPCPYTNLSWPAISGATGYQIQYQVFKPSTGEYRPITTVTSSSSFATVYFGTLPGTGWNIHYKVSANCGSGYGNYSDWSANFFLQ